MPKDESPLVGREAMKAWWTGNKETPIEVGLEEAPCFCESLLPNSAEDVRLLVRCSVMAIANHAPCSSLRIVLSRLAGAKISRRVYVSPGVLLDPIYPQLLEIGEGALLGIGCRLLTHEYTATTFRLGRIRIGAGSVIGAFATVRSGVSIGSGATIGMNSFVNHDVPDGVVVGGVPARPLGTCNGEK